LIHGARRGRVPRRGELKNATEGIFQRLHSGTTAPRIPGLTHERKLSAARQFHNEIKSRVGALRERQPGTVTGGVPRPAGRQPVTAARQKQGPLMRCARSAAETSTGSRPIGSELGARAHPEGPVCQARPALAQEQQRDPACLH
jgi:hypothetical protein